MWYPNWLHKWMDRRRSPRRLVDSLAAVYWDGATAHPHPVPVVSLHGAFLETSENWHVGTLIHFTLEHLGRPEAPVSPESCFVIWAAVVRKAAGGLCVEFVFENELERETLQRFLQTFAPKDKCERHDFKKQVAQRAVAH
jgi:hypothetical protein